MPPATSWVSGASDPDGDFPLQNLPLCVFRPAGSGDRPRIGVGIGRSILDLAACAPGLLSLPEDLRHACAAPSLNSLIALGRPAMRVLRGELQALLGAGAPKREHVEALLVPQVQARFELPVATGEYTDFLASYHHAFNVGSLYRPTQPVLPNFATLPIAYHGRASTLVASGEPVYRPRGQFRSGHAGSHDVQFGATKRLDFEVELAAFVGVGNRRGCPIGVGQASEHIAGISLLNDWSARDIQAWESQPLGPFQGKNFATSLSPWLVTLEALEPYRVAAAPRRPEHGAVANYLREPEGARTAYPIHVETRLSTRRMRREGLPDHTISRALFSRDSYWTFGQMLAHHTVNGCSMRTGDLVGSGTLSGPSDGSEGSLLELTRGGARPLALPNGESRTFLEDGDEVVLTAHCIAPGLPRLGFGECRARIEPFPLT